MGLPNKYDKLMPSAGKKKRKPETSLEPVPVDTDHHRGQPPDFTEDDVRNAFENYFGRCWNPDGTLANDDDDKLLKREWDAGNILDDEARRQSQIASLMPSHLEKVDTNQSLEASPQEDHFRSPPPSQAASEGSEFGPNA